VQKYIAIFAQVPVLSGTARDRACAIAERCGGGHEHHENWTVCCPAHDDKTPSLSITPEGGRVLLHCFAGCEPLAVLRALGLTWRDLFDDGRDCVPPPARPRHLGPRIPEPPGGPTPENMALQVALELIVDDCKLLEVKGCQILLREAATAPLKKLWIDQQLRRHRLDPATVWRIVQPTPPAPLSGLRTISLPSHAGVAVCQTATS